MKATIGLEHFGYDTDRGLFEVQMPGRRPVPAASLLGGRGVKTGKRPWVARIVGKDSLFGLAREFVPPKTDYKGANRAYSRGVKLWFVLDPGVYEVRSFTSWRREDRYFCRANNDGSLERLTREQVDRWLNALSE